jgi:hypothetical protein
MVELASILTFRNLRVNCNGWIISRVQKELELGGEEKKPKLINEDPALNEVKPHEAELSNLHPLQLECITLKTI